MLSRQLHEAIEDRLADAVPVYLAALKRVLPIPKDKTHLSWKGEVANGVLGNELRFYTSRRWMGDGYNIQVVVSRSPREGSYSVYATFRPVKITRYGGARDEGPGIYDVEKKTPKFREMTRQFQVPEEHSGKPSSKWLESWLKQITSKWGYYAPDSFLNPERWSPSL